MKYLVNLCFLITLLTVLKQTPHSVTGQHLYECSEFKPNDDTCGRSLPNTGARWVVHKTIGLADVESAMNIFQEFILYHNNSGSGFAQYELAGLNQTALILVGSVCLTFEIVQSHNCIDSENGRQKCNYNATLQIGPNVMNPDHTLTYQEAGWTFYNAQFNVTNNQYSDDGTKLRKLIIQSYVTNSTDILPVPYVAIRRIQVTGGLCPSRIGPRKGFWVFMLAVFVFMNVAIILYVSMFYMRHEHRRRVLEASLRHPSILAQSPRQSTCPNSGHSDDAFTQSNHRQERSQSINNDNDRLHQARPQMLHSFNSGSTI